MSIWLGAGLAATISLRETGVARAAAGYLTSVIIRLLFNGDGKGWWETLVELATNATEFLRLVVESGLSTLKDPMSVLKALWGKGEELAPSINAWVVRLLETPPYFAEVLRAIFGFLVVAGTLLLLLKLSAYLAKLGYRTFEGYSPQQIANGEAGLVNPYVYFWVRFLPAFTVIVATPGGFLAIWHVLHYYMIAGLVQIVYGSSTIGADIYEILVHILDGKTLLWMFSNAPVFVISLTAFLTVYGLLNLANVAAWCWMLVRVAQYGDGESSKEVITDTARWAFIFLGLVVLSKIEVWLTPKVLSILMGFIPPVIAINVWLLFMIFTPVLAVIGALLLRPLLRSMEKPFTVHHIVQAEYVPTNKVSRKVATQTVSYARAVWQGAKTARRLLA